MRVFHLVFTKKIHKTKQNKKHHRLYLSTSHMMVQKLNLIIIKYTQRCSSAVTTFDYKHVTKAKCTNHLSLVHIIWYSTRSYTIIHRFWTTTGSWYWFEEFLNLRCTPCERSVPEVIPGILFYRQKCLKNKEIFVSKISTHGID